MINLRHVLFALGLLLSSEAVLASSIQVAQKVISKIDYVPFNYTKDGCYARALYMGMELAVHGIAATNKYVFGNLQPDEKTRWRYHVAPMIPVNGGRDFAVLDPSLNPKPMSRKRWLQLNNPQGLARVHVAPASHYASLEVPKLAAKGAYGFDMETQAKKVKELPEYQIADIANACRTAWRYIGSEPINQSSKYQKRRKLILKTKYLINRLQDLGRIGADAELVSCRRATYRS